MKPALLIVAHSGRLLAQAARQAGYRPLVVDAFGDLDTRAAAAAVEVVGAFRPPALMAAARALIARHAPVGWLYGPGVEAFPETIAELSRLCPLYGNPAEVVCECVEPERFFRWLRALEIPFPEVRRTAPGKGAWLFKRPGTSGGEGVYRCPGPADGRGGYFQRYVPGPVHCLAFVADGEEILWHGFNTLLTCPYNDDRPYRFRGIVNRARLPRRAARRVIAAARCLVSSLGLVGWHGLDFILDAGGCPQVLELNPRPGASVAVWGRAWARGPVALQLAACRRRPLPPGRLPPPAAWEIVFAPRRLLLERWDWPAWCADLPLPGTVIATGAPVCSIEARGRSPRQAMGRLALRRRWLERQLKSNP
ncbi:conserved hypothetical protein [Methylomarinovum caldicuralii]|uniref:ATP-grasp fold PylC-type domain-containing protein n=1 Tax=Methylomarinovum caldicuralii TaxID=438856 RepID=A0AAU9BSJ8_9GAMM|nr:ATP-grasp domain-containing protein [Methylomarinovum caldicuralii]BCX81858.1 conserved hypothetical protein [Methylomarinovum caldicuralii]